MVGSVDGSAASSSLNGDDTHLAKIKEEWDRNHTMDIAKIWVGGVGIMPATLPQYLEYLYTQKDQPNGAAERYVANHRRYMPWALSKPFFQSLLPHQLSSISLGFMWPSQHYLDLTLVNGFCPSFIKENTTCTAGTALGDGSDVYECTANTESIDCCNKSGITASENNLVGFGAERVEPAEDMVMDSTDLVVHDYIRNYFGTDVQTGMVMGVTEPLGVAIKQMFWNEQRSRTEFLNSVDHASYTGLYNLGLVIALITTVIVWGMFMALYPAVMTTIRLDMMFDDKTVQQDAMSILRLCETLFAYTVELDDNREPVSRSMTNPNLHAINSKYSHDVRAGIWACLDAANLARSFYDADGEGHYDLVTLAGFMTHKWLERAEHLLFDLKSCARGHEPPFLFIAQCVPGVLSEGLLAEYTALCCQGDGGGTSRRPAASSRRPSTSAGLSSSTQPSWMNKGKKISCAEWTDRYPSQRSD